MGLWSRLFRKPRPIFLGRRDCHCHVVPGVDDGSRTMDESLDILRLLVAEGVRTVVATPHIYPGKFDNEPDALRYRFDALEAARAAIGLAVSLELGAEHWLDASLVGRIAARRVLSFGPERYVLFETSTGPDIPASLYDAVHALSDAGFTPLLAHVERYAYLRKESGEEVMADLRAAGARFQVNRTVGELNLPGHGVRGRFLARLLERGWVDEVGSDLHRPTARGRPHAIPRSGAAGFHQTTRKPTDPSP